MKLLPAPLPDRRARPLPVQPNDPAADGDPALFVRVIDIQTDRPPPTAGSSRKLGRRADSSPRPRPAARENAEIILLHL